MNENDNTALLSIIQLSSHNLEKLFNMKRLNKKTPALRESFMNILNKSKPCKVYSSQPLRFGQRLAMLHQLMLERMQMAYLFALPA